MADVVALRKEPEPEPEHGGGGGGPEISLAICPDCEGFVFSVVLKGDDIDYLECANQQCRAWLVINDG